jgi:hypothetical protein
MTIANSTISDNHVESCPYGVPPSSKDVIAGGGIYNASRAHSLTITGSTIASNTISGGPGGGIYDGFSDPSSTSKNVFTLTNSTIVRNRTGSNGGGLVFFGSLATLTFCTIYGNTAVGAGGGIFTFPAVVHNTGLTIAANVAVGNSVIAANQAGTGSDVAGTLSTAGYNLLSSFSGVTFNDPLNRHATDMLEETIPHLGIDSVLRQNGGPTQTLALLPGSPAIDNIPLAACHTNGNSPDQRGVRRPQGSRCDMGAFEYVPS